MSLVGLVGGTVRPVDFPLRPHRLGCEMGFCNRAQDVSTCPTCFALAEMLFSILEPLSHRVSNLRGKPSAHSPGLSSPGRPWRRGREHRVVERSFLLVFSLRMPKRVHHFEKHFVFVVEYAYFMYRCVPWFGSPFVSGRPFGLDPQVMFHIEFRKPLLFILRFHQLARSIIPLVPFEQLPTFSLVFCGGGEGGGGLGCWRAAQNTQGSVYFPLCPVLVV